MTGAAKCTSCKHYLRGKVNVMTTLGFYTIIEPTIYLGQNQTLLQAGSVYHSGRIQVLPEGPWQRRPEVHPSWG